ncbi:hypothetical protein C8Q74DRAFT_1216307 [Fomes fomentarius]|nr:hypothetical protein C8Q74DRAFT_1216307 [Fomes fomentarius]
MAVSETVDDLSQALTVEEFLRRSATSTKWYSTRRSRRLRRNLVPLRSKHTAADNSTDSDYQPDSEDQAESSPYPAGRGRGQRIAWTSDEDNLIPEKPAKKRRWRRQKKSTEPLSARILAAAIATGVDVVGGPLLPVSSSGLGVRRHLPSIAANRAASPTGVNSKVKTERRHFVDPRKGTPFDRAVFEFGQAGVDGEDGTGNAVITQKPKASRPITAWMPDGETFALANAQVMERPRRSIKKASPSAAMRPVAVPLESMDAAKRQKR